MDPHLVQDIAQLPDVMSMVHKHAAAVLEDVAERDVLPTRAMPEAQPLTESGIGLRAALDDFATRWEPCLSASSGPRYWGFVTGGVTPAALAGDWLTATWDQNAFSLLDAAGHHLEQEAVNWLRELFGIGPAHQGMFVSGATMSNMVGLAIAREWLGQRLGIRPADDGAAALGPVRVLSGNAHSSVSKALSVLGLGRKALIQVATIPGREAVDPRALEQALQETSGPCIVVANAGTVNTGDFDDIRAIAALRDRYDFWLHVDAAFGAFAVLSPEHAHLADGLELADSICIDLHKWLNVPYDSAVQFTRHRDLQTRVFHNAAAYLGPLGADADPLHSVPENSRRLRALAAWFTLRAYGRAGHSEIVQRCIACAHRLADGLGSIPELQLIAPVHLNVVCFTLTEDPTADRVNALARRLHHQVFLTPTVLAGTPALRAAFSNWRTTDTDVDTVLEAIADTVHDLT
ncbi:pyridoxal phosphate-dependent decarboxylase family protein [Nocardia sp. 004]|uniref:pyridoxal phosphate-dependent decarboxylase family protein n=1 Tax=Nocardia sp. 004 TaxID=3385978 RepID=UPI0039A26C41